MRHFFRWRYRRIAHFMQHAHQVQQTVLQRLVQSSTHTRWGRQHNYKDIDSYTTFAKNVPIQDYESLKPYINAMMLGERDVLWSGRVKWFSKSSGTTNDKSKFIPVSMPNLRECHIRGNWDVSTLLYHNLPDAAIFDGKSLIMGGSWSRYDKFPETNIGDVSAIMLQHLPTIARPFFAPSLDIALMNNWDQKIERMAQALINEKDMVLIGGVPTWTVVLFRKLLELSGKTNILEIFPRLQAYIHGGVGFEPYQHQFEQFLPSPHIQYIEVYNATEGYFAIQNDKEDDLLLLLNNGMFFEFLPQSEWYAEHPRAVPLAEVTVGENYALVISTNAGLWRYLIGDTIVFTATQPYKIKITGRIKQYINAFGEEVMVANTDAAIGETCQQLDAIVSDYTVAPIYFSEKGKGSHQWLIEFDKIPSDVNCFAKTLDANLQKLNSDYEAKRFGELALEQLHLHVLPKGTFHEWLKSKGKYGGQHKVPRLANNRQYIEEILKFKQPIFIAT